MIISLWAPGRVRSAHVLGRHVWDNGWHIQPLNTVAPSVSPWIVMALMVCLQCWPFCRAWYTMPRIWLLIDEMSHLFILPRMSHLIIHLPLWDRKAKSASSYPLRNGNWVRLNDFPRSQRHGLSLVSPLCPNVSFSWWPGLWASCLASSKVLCGLYCGADSSSLPVFTNSEQKVYKAMDLLLVVSVKTAALSGSFQVTLSRSYPLTNLSLLICKMKDLDHGLKNLFSFEKIRTLWCQK